LHYKVGNLEKLSLLTDFLLGKLIKQSWMTDFTRSV